MAVSRMEVATIQPIQTEKRHPKRAGLGASVVFGLALLQAACQAQVPPTENPTQTPESTPSPVPTLVTPSPEATASAISTPSQEPTPTATASPTETPNPNEWPYKTLADAQKAWNNGEILKTNAQKWHYTGAGLSEPYGNYEAKRNVENTKEYLTTYPAVLLGSQIIDNADGSKDVEILVGMEGRLKTGTPGIDDVRERFTAVIRISNGINGHAELEEVSVLDDPKIGSLGANLTTAQDVYNRLQEREGANILFVSQVNYDGDWVNPPAPDLDQARRDQLPAARVFFHYTWDELNNKSSAAPTNVNILPGEISADSLILTNYMFIHP